MFPLFAVKKMTMFVKFCSFLFQIPIPWNRKLWSTDQSGEKRRYHGDLIKPEARKTKNSEEPEQKLAKKDFPDSLGPKRSVYLNQKNLEKKKAHYGDNFEKIPRQPKRDRPDASNQESAR